MIRDEVDKMVLGARSWETFLTMIKTLDSILCVIIAAEKSLEGYTRNCQWQLQCLILRKRVRGLGCQVQKGDIFFPPISLCLVWTLYCIYIIPFNIERKTSKPLLKSSAQKKNFFTCWFYGKYKEVKLGPCPQHIMIVKV